LLGSYEKCHTKQDSIQPYQPFSSFPIIVYIPSHISRSKNQFYQQIQSLEVKQNRLKHQTPPQNFFYHRFMQQFIFVNIYRECRERAEVKLIDVFAFPNNSLE
jgi:hypothetical protein